jgi:hypothetical protein
MTPISRAVGNYEVQKISLRSLQESGDLSLENHQGQIPFSYKKTSDSNKHLKGLSDFDKILLLNVEKIRSENSQEV